MLGRKQRLGQYAVDQLASISKDIELLSAEKGYGDQKVRSMVLSFNSLSFQVLERVKCDPEYKGLEDKAAELHRKSVELMEIISRTEEATSEPAAPKK